MQSRLIKDSTYKKQYAQNYIKKEALNSIMHACKYNFDKTIVSNAFISLNSLTKSTYKTYNKNRCIITGKPRYVLNKFGLSRSTFKNYAFENKLPGLKRSSW